MIGREDTSAQEAAVAEAFTDLGDALETLATEAKAAAKIARRKRPGIALDRVRAAIRDLDHAENSVDTATYDLGTARGADG